MNETAPLKVLHIAPTLDGGVAAVLYLLIQQMEARGVRCAVFGMDGKRKQFADICTLGAHLGEKRRLLELLLTHRFDIAHFTLTLLVYDRVAAVLKLPAQGPRTVCTSHGSAPINEARPFPADAYTAVSAGAVAGYPWPTPSPALVIPNAPDTRVFFAREAPPSPRPKLLWVGRTLDMDWLSKDVYGFLHLAATLTPGEFDLVLVDTQERAEELGLKSWLAGRIDYRWGLTRQQMAELYCEVAASGGAWVSTSRSEGMPMCLLEAWACGCPIIVPRSPGFEFVEEGKNAFVYDRGEGLAGIHRCLAQLRCEEKRRAVAEGALAAIAGPYNPATIADTYLELYRSLLGERGAGANGAKGLLRNTALRVALRTYNRVWPPRPPKYAE